MQHVRYLGGDGVLTSLAGTITEMATSVLGVRLPTGRWRRISIMQGYDLTKLDTDNSGTVSLNELQDALRARFEGVWNKDDGSIDAQIKSRIFLKFDTDSSGTLI